MLAEVQIAHIITGIIGGLIRGLVGITKQSTFTPDEFKFHWKYFGLTMLVSGVVGAQLVAYSYVNTSYAFAHSFSSK